MAIRTYDTDLRAAFDEASAYARAIANHIVAGVDVPDDLLDSYTRARGVVDRLVDEAVGDTQHASYYGEHMHAGPRVDCRICPMLPPAALDEPRFGDVNA